MVIWNFYCMINVYIYKYIYFNWYFIYYNYFFFLLVVARKVFKKFILFEIIKREVLDVLRLFLINLEELIMLSMYICIELYVYGIVIIIV